MSTLKEPILLVEDDNIDIMVVQRLLAKHGINVPLQVARHGIEALDMLRGDGGHEAMSPLPKYILLDINMPYMNGLEFLENLRQDPDFDEIKVIMITTSDARSDVNRSFELRANDYLLKPIKDEDLLRAISS